MGNILLLDELTINKIAAGEVIERPASVIKEMIENSIDANATSITIEIKNGGISYIKITDNGKGIAQDDLEMAFERHATSKIRCAEDLNTVASMGFRGEALASIAAIAKVEMTSKTAKQQTGYKITVEGGDILETEEVACQTGTTITVQNLFYNTPVRYKFLKKDYTEAGYVEDVVTRTALVNPHISFKLINSGKTILQTAGNGDLKGVIYSIYGKDIARSVVEVNYNFEDVQIKGVIGKPEIARSNRSNQLFFVNKRYVKDKILIAATEQAYKGLIESGKFGFVVLNIIMPQNKVDVNVHPAKLEVRFEEEGKIFQAIYHSIKDTISRENAKNDSITQVDNIIIQSRNIEEKEIEPMEKQDYYEEKTRSGGLFSWRKNKKSEPNTNIIEDLYNRKNNNILEQEELEESKAFQIKEEIPKALEKNNVEEYEETVNTSDILQKLRKINENLKNEKQDEQEKPEENQNEEIEKKEYVIPNRQEKDLPDGSTYTYFGENKEKIEDLLRQLHPETYNKEKNEAVAEENEEYKVDSVEEQPQDVQIEEVQTQMPKLEIAETEIAKSETKTEEQPKEVQIEKMEGPQVAETETAEVKQQENQTEENISSDFRKMYEKTFGTTIVKKEEKEENISAIDIIQENVSVFDGIEKYQKPTYKIIGNIFNSYIIAEVKKEMYIINQNTAKEKIIYEKIKRNYYNQLNKDSQLLLLPDIIEVTEKQLAIIRENTELLSKSGFSLEEFGLNTIKLTGVPTICLDLDTKQVFIEVIESLNTVARTSIQEKEDKFLATIAEKIAQKTPVIVGIKETDALMDELLSYENPFTYNINKPIAIKMTKYDIERKFSRK